MSDRIWANRKTDGELYVGIDRIIDDNADRAEYYIMYAEPPVFKKRWTFETDDLTAMCTITDEMAVELMDSLWRAGIRPTEGKNDE